MRRSAEYRLRVEGPVDSGRRGRRTGQTARMRLREKILRTEDLCPLAAVKPPRPGGKLARGPAGQTRLHLFHSSLPHRDTETYWLVRRVSRHLCQKKAQTAG